MANITPAQVYAQVLAMGGTTLQAQVGAALVDGIESNGDPTILSGGVGPAAGLFQFEPATWRSNGGGTYAPVAQDASWQDQVQVFVNASKGNNFGAWGPDLVSSRGDPNSSSNPAYGYSGAPQPGSEVADKIASLGPTISAGSSLPATDWASLKQAGAEGGTAYLEAMNAAQAGQGAAGGTPTSAAAAQSVVIDGQTYTTPAGDPNASAQVSAIGQMAATLAGYGFSGSDLQTLVSWSWGEMTGLVDPSQIAIDMQTPGSAVYPIFEKQFPGFTGANQQLTSQGLQAVSVSQYQQYETQAQAMAQAAGLPAGFINKDNIGTLIGGNVSTQELTSRINNALTLAYQSTPEQQEMFNQYFGTQYGNNPWTPSPPGGYGPNPQSPSGHGPLTVGQIAALALDPNVAEPLIAQQIQAAQIGGASVTSGVGALNVHTATQLAQAGITEAQATNAFQNLAPLSSLETARPGMGGEAAQGVVSPDQLAIGNLLGNPAAQRQEQTAVEVAKAPFSGGGGYVSTSKGAGVGSANPNGTGNA